MQYLSFESVLLGSSILREPPVLVLTFQNTLVDSLGVCVFEVSF
jgi:hypothetical protein